MESVMNFLANNYIWFFVASGILVFALIGFIIDSKKKSKVEFKGEEVESTTPVTEEVVPTVEEEFPTEVDKTIEINDIPISNDSLEILDTIPEPEELNLSEVPEVPLEETNQVEELDFNDNNNVN